MKKGSLNFTMSPMRDKTTLENAEIADACVEIGWHEGRNAKKLDKQSLRHCLRDLRSSIPAIRREEASLRLYNDLLPKLKTYRSILSFASKPDEIDLWKLNHHLSLQNRLLLPKVVGEVLEIFAVDDISNQLALSPFSILEPIPELCKRASWESIECILVPGLGFDAEKKRIGYGRGHYDRFLKVMKTIAPSVVTIGIGFEEQKVSASIPTEPHDIPVDELLFF